MVGGAGKLRKHPGAGGYGSAQYTFDLRQQPVQGTPPGNGPVF